MADRVLHNQIINYYKDLLKSFKHDLHKLKSSLGKKTIHNIRLDIKKLRVLYNLIKEIYHGKFDSKDYSKAYKGLFKAAGKIREAQVNKDLITSYKLPSKNSFCEYFEIREKEARSKLRKRLSKTHIESPGKAKSELMKVLKGLNKEKFTKGCHSLLIAEYEGIKCLRKASLNVKSFHKMRKHFKNLGYLTNLLDKIKPDWIDKHTLTELKKTEKLMGQWHDRVVLIHSLNLLLEHKKIKKIELEPIQKIIGVIKTENNKQLTKLLPRIDKTYLLFVNN